MSDRGGKIELKRTHRAERGSRGELTIPGH